MQKPLYPAVNKSVNKSLYLKACFMQVSDLLDVSMHPIKQFTTHMFIVFKPFFGTHFGVCPLWKHAENFF